MPRMTIRLALCVAAALSCSGCAVVSVTSTVVGVGVSAGTTAVSVAGTVVKGTVSAGGAVVGAVID